MAKSGTLRPEASLLRSSPSLVAACWISMMARLPCVPLTDAAQRRACRRPVELDRLQYGEFLTLATGLFEALRLRTAVVEPPRELIDATVTKPPPPSGGAARVVAIVVVVGALVAIAIWFFTSH